jgi:hypothetical protein
MLRHFATILALSILAASPASAQQWAKKMFKDTDHDFGSVARGAKAEFAFELSNIFVEDVHIVSARSSCGCTSVRVEKPALKTYEKGAIIASLNTGSYQGQRGATITVTLDKPYYAEVQLHVSTYIRSDVVLEPGSVQFGSVEQGVPAESKVVLKYAGRSDWKIVEVRSANPHVKAEAVETSRTSGQVSYNLVVRMDPQTPAGYLSEHLMLVTNDYQSTQVPVAVEGRVLSSVTVSPTSLFMGVVEPGQKVTKQLVIKGSRPFRILSITCDDQSFEFDTSDIDNSKPLHLVPVTFMAGADAGKVTKTIRIVTDLGDAKPELAAYAVVSTAKETAP